MSFVTHNLELLTRHAEHVEALKQHILSLAVRGLLVPQDPADEPAGELLKRIKAEKARLGKEAKIRKQRNYSSIKDEEIPFEVPQNWVWARLDSISYDFGQKVPDRKFTYIDVGSIDQREGRISDEVKILEAKEAPSRARKIVKRGCIIYSTVRPYLLNIALVDKEFDHEPIVSTAFAVINPHEGVSAEYLFWLLRSRFFTEFVESQMVGVAYPAINDQNLFKGLIPLPPLLEQHRIVAKVESLFALIDRLSGLTRQADTVRRQWRRSLLHGLGEAVGGEELRVRWGQLSAHFDTLIDSKEAVKELRQVILQLAVRGVLVEQDPQEEPASELLKRVRAEKKRLGKKEEGLAVARDEAPYEAPKGWVWVRLGEVCKQITDGTHQTPKYTAQGRIFISAKNVKPFRFMPENCKYVSEEDYLKYIENRKPECGDILLTRVGSNIGEAAKVDKPLDFAIYVSVALLKLFQEFSNPDYFLIWLNSPDGTEKSLRYTYGRGMSQGNLNLGLIKNFLFPLPPLPEQRRIVERVELLMGWCDGMEAAFEAREGVMGRIMGGLNQMI